MYIYIYIHTHIFLLFLIQKFDTAQSDERSRMDAINDKSVDYDAVIIITLLAVSVALTLQVTNIRPSIGTVALDGGPRPTWTMV